MMNYPHTVKTSKLLTDITECPLKLAEIRNAMEKATWLKNVEYSLQSDGKIVVGHATNNSQQYPGGSPTFVWERF